jgi:hypothetical protein
MLPIHAPFARRASESHARSALPGAPVRPVDDVASRLIALADRVSPEPVERSRWQSG